jgi:hypothetical protein
MNHFEHSSSLKARFISEISKFLHGSHIEIFERHDDYFIGQSSAVTINPDDPLAVALRKSLLRRVFG